MSLAHKPLPSFRAFDAQRFGVHSNAGYYSAADVETEFGYIDTLLNATCVRAHMRWDDIEAGATKPESKDWTPWDTVISEASSHGLEPLIMIAGSPQWANGSTTETDIPGSGLDQDYKDFVALLATFMGEAAARYSTVTHWTVWNEVNEPWFWTNQSPDPDLYAYMYEACRTAIKAQIPHAIVGAGAFTGLMASGQEYTGVEFLEALYQAGCYPDAISIHPYSSGASAVYENEVAGPSEDIAWENNFHDIEDIRAMTLTYNRGTTPVWVTEFGWKGMDTPDYPTSWSVTWAHQASYVTDALGQVRDNYPYVTMCTYFLCSDYASPAFAGWGLLEDDYTTRASGTAFKNFMDAL